jgi:predicted transglutaminase-like cysteine proteinase
MRRQNRQKAVTALSKTLWNNTWQAFCPWVAGADVSAPQESATGSRRRRSRLRSIAVLAVMLVGMATSQTAHATPTEADKSRGLLHYASLNTNTPSDRVNALPALFGKTESRHADIRPFTKWTGVLARAKAEFTQPTKSQNVKEWLVFLDGLQGQSDDRKISAVNAYLNKIKFVADAKNYGRTDHWATPTEFLNRGGDCEDYAITKYISLRVLGIPKEKMRLAIVEDHVMRIPHAVLVVYNNLQAKILDNQNPAIMNSAEIQRYTPIYSISQMAWWRH